MIVLTAARLTALVATSQAEVEATPASVDLGAIDYGQQPLGVKVNFKLTADETQFTRTVGLSVTIGPAPQPPLSTPDRRKPKAKKRRGKKGGTKGKKRCGKAKGKAKNKKGHRA